MEKPSLIKSSDKPQVMGPLSDTHATKELRLLNEAVRDLRDTIQLDASTRKKEILIKRRVIRSDVLPSNDFTPITKAFEETTESNKDALKETVSSVEAIANATVVSAKRELELTEKSNKKERSASEKHAAQERIKQATFGQIERSKEARHVSTQRDLQAKFEAKRRLLDLQVAEAEAKYALSKKKVEAELLEERSKVLVPIKQAKERKILSGTSRAIKIPKATGNNELQDAFNLAFGSDEEDEDVSTLQTKSSSKKKKKKDKGWTLLGSWDDDDDEAEEAEYEEVPRSRAVQPKKKERKWSLLGTWGDDEESLDQQIINNPGKAISTGIEVYRAGRAVAGGVPGVVAYGLEKSAAPLAATGAALYAGNDLLSQAQIAQNNPEGLASGNYSTVKSAGGAVVGGLLGHALGGYTETASLAALGEQFGPAIYDSIIKPYLPDVALPDSLPSFNIPVPSLGGDGGRIMAPGANIYATDAHIFTGDQIPPGYAPSTNAAMYAAPVAAKSINVDLNKAIPNKESVMGMLPSAEKVKGTLTDNTMLKYGLMAAGSYLGMKADSGTGSFLDKAFGAYYGGTATSSAISALTAGTGAEKKGHTVDALSDAAKVAAQWATDDKSIPTQILASIIGSWVTRKAANALIPAADDSRTFTTSATDTREDIISKYDPEDSINAAKYEALKAYTENQNGMLGNFGAIPAAMYGGIKGALFGVDDEDYGYRGAYEKTLAEHQKAHPEMYEGNRSKDSFTYKAQKAVGDAYDWIVDAKNTLSAKAGEVSAEPGKRIAAFLERDKQRQAQEKQLEATQDLTEATEKQTSVFDGLSDWFDKAYEGTTGFFGNAGSRISEVAGNVAGRVRSAANEGINIVSKAFPQLEGFKQKSSATIDRLKQDFGLTTAQAAGVVGNLGHESAGMQSNINEKNPTVAGSRGGYGWAQWTGSRRKDFEAFAASKGLDPGSDEANYQFLAHELSTTHKDALSAVKNTATSDEATIAFEKSFERAGVKHYDSRLKYSNIALENYNKAKDVTAKTTIPTVGEMLGSQPSVTKQMQFGTNRVLPTEIASSVTPKVVTNKVDDISLQVAEIKKEVATTNATLPQTVQDSFVKASVDIPEGIQPNTLYPTSNVFGATPKTAEYTTYTDVPEVQTMQAAPTSPTFSVGSMIVNASSVSVNGNVAGSYQPQQDNYGYQQSGYGYQQQQQESGGFFSNLFGGGSSYGSYGSYGSNPIDNVVNSVKAVPAGILGGILGPIFGDVASIANAPQNIMQGAMGTVQGYASNAMSIPMNAANSTMSTVNGVVSMPTNAMNSVTGIANSAIGIPLGAYNNVTGAANQVMNIPNQASAGFGNVSSGMSSFNSGGYSGYSSYNPNMVPNVSSGYDYEAPRITSAMPSPLNVDRSAFEPISLQMPEIEFPQQDTQTPIQKGMQKVAGGEKTGASFTQSAQAYRPSIDEIPININDSGLMLLNIGYV